MTDADEAVGGAADADRLAQRVAELEAQVAEQAQTIAKLQADAERYAKAEIERSTLLAVLECCTDFVGIATLEGEVTFVNETARKLAGLTSLADLAPPALIANFLMPDELPRVEAEVLPALMTKGRWAGEFRFRHIPTGTPIPVFYSAYMVKHPETGEPIALATVTRDLRAEKREAAERSRLLEETSLATAALRHGQERMSQLEEERLQMILAVENSTDFIGLCTLEGIGMYLNAAGRELVGLDDDADLRQVDVAQAMTAETYERFTKQVIPSLLASGRWEGELEFKHLKSGEVFPTWYKPFLIRDPQTGEPRSIGAIAQDLRGVKRAEAERREMQEEIIRAQAAALAELSTPLIPISERVVVMPLIGAVDEARAARVIESLLAGVNERGARVAILDITGVSTVDATVAEGLVSAARAVGLLGAEVILTGIRSDVARALIELGVDLGTIVTRGTLQAGIAFAMRRA